MCSLVMSRFSRDLIKMPKDALFKNDNNICMYARSVSIAPGFYMIEYQYLFHINSINQNILTDICV